MLRIAVLPTLCLVLLASPVPSARADQQPSLPAASQIASVSSTNNMSEAGRSKLDVVWANKSASLDVVDADVRDVLKLLSEKSGIEIEVFTGVTGKVTLRATNAPLEKVVDDLLAAVGQRNYLMVFDGGGLTKLSVVPKGTGGAGLSAEAKRVKVKGTLRNGKEIEYYPGEIVVFGAVDFKDHEKSSAFISDLESRFSLSLLSKSRVWSSTALIFRILNGRDALQVMYDLRDYFERQASRSYVLPNGLGSQTVEIPNHDWHVIKPGFSKEDYAAAQSGKTSLREIQMKKYDFLRWGEVYPAKMGRPYQLNTISIYLKESDAQRITYDDILALANDEGGNIISAHRYAGDFGTSYVLLFPEAGDLDAYNALLRRLHKNPLFSRAKEEHTGPGFVSWGVPNGIPSDPYYTNGSQWNISKIRAEHAWDIASGKNTITIAVIDYGIKTSHEELGSNLSPLSADCSDSILGCQVGLDKVIDMEGHGTAVAGIAAAITNNGKGISGVAGGNNSAPNTGAIILVLKVDHGDAQGEADAVNYAKDHADVINLSWDWLYREPMVPDAIHAAATKTPVGAVVVGAADNPPPPIVAHELTYAACEGTGYSRDLLQHDIIVVGASTVADTRRADTNWGEVVHVYAPGDNIWSTTKDGGYANVGWGTSFAAPHVAGLAALIRSMNPNFTTAQVIDFIDSTADMNLPLENNKGRINAYAALRRAQGISKDTGAPTKPTDGHLIREPSDVRVTWRPATDNEDAIGEYAVLRREFSGNSCTDSVTVMGQDYCQLARVFADGTNDSSAFTSSIASGTFTFIDNSVVDGEWYGYRLIAYDKTGNASEPTDEMDTLPPGKPTHIEGVGGNGKSKLVWAAPEMNEDNSTQPTDLAGYSVYYDTTPALANPSTKWSSNETVELTGLSNGTVYFACVKAVDTTGNESACSETVTVKPEDAIWVHASGGPSGSYASISDALAAAGRGDTIMVGPGVYQESELLVGGEGTTEWDPWDVTLRSERGPGETIIEGDGSHPFALSMADQTRIIGFTIRNGGETGIHCWFHEGILVANNIFISNDVGVYVGGTPWEGGRSVRIYNNVFVGNVRSARGIQGAQYYSENDPSIEIKNNIFQGVSGQGAIGVNLNYCQNVVIEYNDFSGLSKAIVVSAAGSATNFKPSQRSNFTFSPGFVNFSAIDPEDGDYHLADGSLSRDAGSTSLSYDGQAWEDCDGTRTDLGAYGGPFAYVDNDQEGDPYYGIPDCMQSRAVSVAMAVMTNTADAPVTLKARNQTADLAYQVVEQPTLGTLAGTAPILLYSSGSVAGQDGMSFTVANAMGESDPALVDIRVKSSNVPPAAVDQTVRMSKNEVGAVVLQGTDADGDALTFVVDSSPNPLAISCPDLPTCYLLPIDGFEGTTSFTFHANDGFADSPPATVTVAVGPVFLFLSPGEIDVRTNADTFTVAWSDDPAGSRLISLYAVGEALAVDVPESDASNSYIADISSLPDGKYEISAVLDDRMLFEEISAKGLLVIDRTGPFVWAEPAGGVRRFGEVQLLANEDASVYYTLDGSAPSVASPKYTEPIRFTSDLTIRFIAVDGLGNSSEVMEEVYVIHHPPTDMDLSATTIPENEAAGAIVGTLSTIDLDVGDTITYEVVANPGTDYGSFQISGDQLLTAAVFDYEGQQSHTVIVRATDQDGFWILGTFAIAVSDVNEAPVFVGGPDQLLVEDAGFQSVPGWVTGISGGPGGESAQSLDFIVSNDNTSLFALQPAISPTGTLSFTSAEDAHGSATVTVRLHDNGGTAGGGVDTSDPQSFTITVTSVNDAPTDIVLWYDSVSNIAAAGTLVGTLSTTDADVGDVFTYALALGAGDNASFEIIGNELRVLVPLDFTVTNPYSVHVRSTDLAGASIEEVFTVSAPAAYVLWTRSDTGQAVLWKVDPTAGTGSPKVIPISELAFLYSTSGIGAPWEATSFEYVSATEAYVLWTRSDTGQAVLWRIDPSAASGSPRVIPISEMASIHSASGIGGPWRATSYAHVSATEGYVLWTRSDTGQAVLWKINPSSASGTPRVVPRTDLASLQSTTGAGSQWQATSYEHVSATEGYVLWTRSDTGRGVLWKIDPSAGSGSPKIIPVGDLASLQSTTGVGSQWQATSYEYVSSTEAYVLWTRSDTGRAVQWRIDPSAAGGSPKIIPVSDLASIYSTSGTGSPWLATSYFRIGQVREGTEQEFNPSAPEGSSWFGTEVETGVQTGGETGVEIGIEWMMGIWNEQEFWIAQ